MKEIAVTHGRRIIAIKAAPADPRDTLRRFGPDFEAKYVGGQQVGAIVAKQRDFIEGDPPPPTPEIAATYLDARRRVAENVGIDWCGVRLRADQHTRALILSAIVAERDTPLTLPALDAPEGGKSAEYAVAEITPAELPALHRLLTEHVANVARSHAEALAMFLIYGEQVSWCDLDALPWPDN